MSRLRFLPSLMMPMCFVVHALDSASHVSIETRSKPLSDAVITDQKKRLAQQWGLEEEELERYRTLMQGPLGTYSPNLDPLSALGIEARTEAERHRYALLQVDAEAARVEKLLVYQRAYDQAWKERHPKLELVSLPPVSSPLLTKLTERKAVFVRFDCPECVAKVRQLQGSGSTFDLYIVDSQHDDRRIRQWAQNAGIAPDKVRSGIITINHDNGRWGSIAVQGDLPAVVHRVNGTWIRQ